MASIVAQETAERFAFPAGLDPMGHARQVVRDWAGRFVAQTDEAHGFPTW